MVYVIHQLKQEQDSQQKGRDADWKKRNYDYLMEITDSNNDYNSVLTQWIQMRQGDVSLKIEGFDLQDLFDMVERSRTSFRIKGIDLQVKPTDLKVKADKTLTLFMINTIADNARKFSKVGGVVKVEANGMPDYVEISILDNGPGMTKEKLSHIFDRTYTGGHGFGLKNCNGIIEKYNKQYRTKDVLFNCEMIPAENVGVKHAKWDREDGYFVPRDCYNSYFYIVEDDSLSIIDKFKLHGAPYIEHLTGGSALHMNLEEHLSKAQYRQLLKVAAKEGCNYFTFNIPNTICNDCGHIDKRYLHECPHCHSKNVDYMTRIIGYLKRVSNFSQPRQEEAHRRFYAGAERMKA